MIEDFKRLEKKWIFKNIDKETLIQNLISLWMSFTGNLMMKKKQAVAIKLLTN